MGDIIPPKDKKQPNLNPNPNNTAGDTNRSGLFEGAGNTLKTTANIIVQGASTTLRMAGAAIDPNNSTPASSMLSEAGTGLGNMAKTAGLGEGAARAAETIGQLGSAVLKISDAMSGYEQSIAKSTLASENLQKVTNESGATIDQFYSGLAEVTKATGLNADQVSKYYSDLFKSSTFLATGFDRAASSSERLEKTYSLLADTTKVARMTGMEFSDVAGTMTQMLESQGEAGDKTLSTLAYMQDKIQGLGLTMAQGAGHVRDLAKTFEGLGFSSEGAASAIATAVIKQKELSELGRYTFMSPQKAAEGMTAALGGVAKAQKDLGQSMFMMGLQGGGMGETFEFMFNRDMGPEERLGMMAKSMGNLFGGDMMTVEEARKTGNYEQFMYQNQVLQQQLGLASPQQAAEVAGMMEQVAQGEMTPEEMFGKVDAIQGKGQDKLGDLKATHDKWYPKISNQLETINMTLGGSRVAAQKLARETGLKGLQATVGSDVAAKLEEFVTQITEKDPFKATDDARKILTSLTKDVTALKEDKSLSKEDRDTKIKERTDQAKDNLKKLSDITKKQDREQPLRDDEKTQADVELKTTPAQINEKQRTSKLISRANLKKPSEFTHAKEVPSSAYGIRSSGFVGEEMGEAGVRSALRSNEGSMREGEFRDRHTEESSRASTLQGYQDLKDINKSTMLSREEEKKKITLSKAELANRQKADSNLQKRSLDRKDTKSKDDTASTDKQQQEDRVIEISVPVEVNIDGQKIAQTMRKYKTTITGSPANNQGSNI